MLYVKLKCKRVIFVILFICFLSIFVMASNSGIVVAGTYSDVCYNTEGGDALGIEIFIVYSHTIEDKGFYVIFQQFEGAIFPPVLVKATVKEDMTIDFNLPKSIHDVRSKKFHGIITKKGIKGSFEGYDKTEEYGNIWLKRQPSYWQQGSLKRTCN